MKTLSLLVIPFFILSIYSDHSKAAFNYDPSLDWFTLTTDHFYIHFHDNEEPIAREVAVIAEKVHSRISQIFNWEPALKTNIILNDRVDLSNGAATPIPDNRMYLYVTPPDKIGSLEDLDNWMELLITHEYTHIVHIDKAANIPNALRYVFGRFPLFFPNAFQPNWLIEGLATYFETDVNRGIGRGQSSLFSMMMRTEVEHGIKPFSQISLPFVSWPLGTSWYLYGVYYYQFIAQRYGAEKIMQLVDNQSDNIIPFMVNYTSSQTFGLTYKHMWPKYKQYLRTKFEPQIDAIKNAGIKQGRRMTSGGYIKQRPLTLSNGDVLFYENGYQDDAKLIYIDITSNSQRVVSEVHDGRFDATLESGIILAQPDAYRNTNIFMDLYHIDIQSGHNTRLTYGKRYKNVSWDPTGKHIIAVHNNAGNSSLHLYKNINTTRELNDPTILWQGHNKEVIAQLDWSPNSRQIVAAVWRSGSGWNLELFDLDTRTWQSLTQSETIEAQPTFVQQGEAVVFTSDIDGVYNIYQIDINSRKTKKLTNLVGGGFYPALSPDEYTLYYAGYNHQGYDIYEIPISKQDDIQFDSQSFIQADMADPRLLVVKKSEMDSVAAAAQDLTAPINKYSPWRSLAPKWWSPSAYTFLYSKDFQLFGISTSGNDALDRHSINLDLQYILNLELPGGSLYYVYDRWDPAFALQIQRQAVPILNSNNSDIVGYNNTDLVALQAILPFFRFDWQFNIHAAASYLEDHDFLHNKEIVPRSKTNEYPVGLALTYNTAKRYPISVSANNGFSLKLVAENSDLVQSDYHGSVLTLDMRSYFSLGKQRVFAAHIAGGFSTGGSRPFQLGGTQSLGALDLVFNKRNYSLRGFNDSRDITGTNMITGSMEFRFPFTRVERGTSIPIPIGIHQFFGSLFLTGGTAWDNKETLDEFYSAGGVELNTEFILLYNAIINVRLGFAKPFTPDIGLVYLNVNTSF